MEFRDEFADLKYPISLYTNNGYVNVINKHSQG